MEAIVLLADNEALIISVVAALALVAIVAVVLVMRKKGLGVQQQAQAELEKHRAAAQAEAQRMLAQAEAQTKIELLKLREKFDQESDTVRQELRAEEKRIAKREDMVDQKMESANSKEKMQEAAANALIEREKALVEKDRQIADLINQQKAELLRVANLSMEEAKSILIAKVEKDMEKETAHLIQKRLDEAKDTSEVQAREIIISAIQRYAADQTTESTVSAVDIPSDEMKGRVIGREGRNIRAFEKATGVDVIVDDTPGVVVVSGFDPIRREIARRSLEKLIQDGRIHPTRIEEIVSGMEKEVAKQVNEEGKKALIDANIRGMHGKLVELLGRLHFRTSYGQNVLNHSMEVAYLSQIIAEEMGLNGALARRAGLLHDIGKAVDHEVEGTHPDIGADLCKRYGEREEVINAVAGHHGDVVAKSPYTPIVAAADAISASRPGARRESLERYVQRLQKLEEIAKSFEGVQQAYAIQAGREVRVIVSSEHVDDHLASKVARDIAKRIEDEMEYPGEIKVTLVRELRCVEYAR